jgi:hypothetical protein
VKCSLLIRYVLHRRAPTGIRVQTSESYSTLQVRILFYTVEEEETMRNEAEQVRIRSCVVQSIPIFVLLR